MERRLSCSKGRVQQAYDVSAKRAASPADQFSKYIQQGSRPPRAHCPRREINVSSSGRGVQPSFGPIHYSLASRHHMPEGRGSRQRPKEQGKALLIINRSPLVDIRPALKSAGIRYRLSKCEQLAQARALLHLGDRNRLRGHPNRALPRRAARQAVRCRRWRSLQDCLGRRYRIGELWPEGS
jgi:hypothetical protein